MSSLEIVSLPTWPSGLKLYLNCFDASQSSYLFDYLRKQLDSHESTLKRRVVHYGHKYPYTISEPRTTTLLKAEDPPEVVQCIANVLTEFNILPDVPNQFIVNEYIPGQSIGAHRDHHPIFAGSVATLSLGSGIEMVFRHRDGSSATTIYLPIGSILVFQGEARYDYTHEIVGRKSDMVDGKKIPRGDRISLTFRKVNDEYLPREELAPPTKKVSSKKSIKELPKRNIETFTDGACKRNPGPGGWGWVEYINNVEVRSDYGGQVMTTNNRMELLAIIRYIEVLIEGECKDDVVVASDSKYCLGGLIRTVTDDPYNIMKGVDGWISGWLRNGWKKNDDLWKRLNEVTVQCIAKMKKAGGTLSFRHVKGHSKIVGNERADELANKGVKR